MGLKDLIITPIYIALFTTIAYFIRPYVTNTATRKYFLPALWVRFAGAIALGLIYQFYYGGGDTFSYWTHGSQWIWEAFLKDPLIAFEIIFRSNQITPTNFEFVQNIWFFKDTDSFFIVRLAGIFDILTYGTYSATSLFFAVFSWSGAWVLFQFLSKKYPGSIRSLSLAILFFPSLFFWGAGLLKDSISLAALFWLTFSILKIIEESNVSFKNIIIAAISIWLILNTKPYIFFCTIPAIFVWLFFKETRRIKSTVLKVLVVPALLIIFGLSGFLAIEKLTNSSEYYSLDNVAKRAWITAYDIRYYTGRSAGSGYSLGEQDGTFMSMIRLAPSGIAVSIFRPFLWEVKNPLMLVMALESFVCLILFLKFLVNGNFSVLRSDPFLMYCLSFSILFAFAVGVSTYNFGTLMRYRIPLLPFFLILVFLSSRKLYAKQG